jgi:uncharacterized protein YgiB involved in biofilm formation
LAAACGPAAPTATPAAKKGESIVYASLEDCIEQSRLEANVCDRIIQLAIAKHEGSKTRFRRLDDCEKVEGEGRCERTTAGDFLPRPGAFLVTLGERPAAQVVYMSTKSGAGSYRTASGSALRPDGDVPLSNRARDRLDDQSRTRRRG